MFIHTYVMYRPYNEHAMPWHVAELNRNELKDGVLYSIRKWCYQTYGDPGFKHNTHEIRWKDSIHKGEILFNRKEDLEWFLLRWQ